MVVRKAAQNALGSDAEYAADGGRRESPVGNVAAEGGYQRKNIEVGSDDVAGYPLKAEALKLLSAVIVILAEAVGHDPRPGVKIFKVLVVPVQHGDGVRLGKLEYLALCLENSLEVA